MYASTRPAFHAVPAALVVMVLALAGTATASPGDHSERWGSTAGDPRVHEDGKACFDALNETGADAKGSTCDVLYAHIFDLRNWVAVNVQRPPEEYTDLARGFPGVPVAYEGLYNFNQLDLKSSPGFVEYQEPGEIPEYHKERGITADVVFDPDAPIIGYWYLSADYDEIGGVDDVPPGSGNGPDVGVLPCLTVRMVLQTGQHAHVGTDLAAGTTTKTIVSAQGEDGAEPLGEIDCPGAGPSDVMAPEEVTEFEVKMAPIVEPVTIPAADGFLIRVEWYQFAPGEPDEQDKVYQGQINVHTGLDHLARVLVPIQNAVVIEKVEPVDFDGKVFVRVVANSPWGSYDVDPGSIDLSLRGPDGATIEMEGLGTPSLRYSVGHDGHFQPVIALFEWDRTAQHLDPGEYELVAVAKNWQHSATAEFGTPMTIDDDRIIFNNTTDKPDDGKRENVPAPGGALVLATLGAVAVVAAVRARRR